MVRLLLGMVIGLILGILLCDALVRCQADEIE